MNPVRKPLTYANVVSSLCLFLVLGGATALAAGHLGKASVGSRQLKKNAVTVTKIEKNAVTEAKVANNAVTEAKVADNAVTEAKLAGNAVTGAKIEDGSVTTTKIGDDAVTGAQVNESTLTTVPSAAVANSIPPLEPAHLVGAPGEPPFENGSSTVPGEGVFNLSPPGFYKDHEGIVHLTGYAKAGTANGSVTVFTLPPGYRPAPGSVALFEVVDGAEAFIAGSGASIGGVDRSGSVLGEEGLAVALEGISYRAGS